MKNEKLILIKQNFNVNSSTFDSILVLVEIIPKLV